MSPQQDQQLRLKTDQRLAIFGRLRMADWIEMPEKEFAKEIEKIEKDPLFKKLFFGGGAVPSAIRRQRWPFGRLSSGLYEINEATMARGERVKVEEALGDKAGLLPKIRRMGREAFEKYFLHGDEPLSLAEIAKRTGLPLTDVQEMHDLLLELGAQAEFWMPSREPSMVRGYSCLARFSLEGEEAVFEFFSPHWARGLYHVRYETIEDWKQKGDLAADERRKLPRLLKRIETVNLRQNTIFRILESLAKLHGDYFRSKAEEDRRPISLRQLAHRLDLSPSTISRALTGRSVCLPWGKEVPLHNLVPGRRKVVREIVENWLKDNPKQTDAALAERLREERFIRISRRTVNAVRNELLKNQP